MKTKCLIVDDEPLAVESVEMYLNEFPDMEVTAKCSSAMEAFEILKKENIDLMFLDIQMPKVTGLDFLRSLKTPPKVILTTAYSEYALDGFDLDVVDYLLKPISLDRFMQAVDKYFRSRAGEKAEAVGNKTEKDFIYVKADRKTVKIYLDTILYIESFKDYVRIKLTDKTITTKNQISTFEDKLPADRFLRIHRSYLISIDKIKSFTAVSVFIDKKELPVSKSYQQDFLNKMDIDKKSL